MGNAHGDAPREPSRNSRQRNRTLLRIAYIGPVPSHDPDEAAPEPAFPLLAALGTVAEVSPFLFRRRRYPAGLLPAGLAAPVLLPERLGAGPLPHRPGRAGVARDTSPAARLSQVMNRRRLERLLARLHRLRPGLILLDGAATAALAPALHSLGCPLAWIPGRREGAATPRLDAAWFPSAEMADAFADQGPAAARTILPTPFAGTADTALLGALRALGLPAQPRAPQPFAVAPEGETLRFNPLTRMLEWNLPLRGAAGASLRMLSGEGRVLDHGYILLHPGRRESVRAEARGVLPLGVAPREVAMEITLPDGSTHRHPAPGPVEERAGLVALSPSRGRHELLAWSLDEDAPMQPAPVERESRPVPRLAARLLRAQIDLPPEAPPPSIVPTTGTGQTLHRPALWTRPRPPSSVRLRDLAGRHRGETAWIIGNGPSVRPEDLDALEGRLTFCFNRFYLAHGLTRLRARYTVTGDRQMIEDFGEEIVARSGGTVLVAAETPPALTGDYLWVRQLPVFPPLFSFQPEVAVSPGGSSLYVALQLGYMMGVRRFLLYGTDFSFHFTQAAGADPFRSAVGDGNHFIPDYRSGRAWCPPALRDITLAFLAARLVIESDGGLIRNTTRGGLLEIFDRQPFEAALALG